VTFDGHAFPHLARTEVPQHGVRAADVVAVAVGQDERRQAAQAERP
jgi:hypothetical protein